MGYTFEICRRLTSVHFEEKTMPGSKPRMAPSVCLGSITRPCQDFNPA